MKAKQKPVPLEQKAKVALEVQDMIADLSRSCSISEPQVAGFLAEIGLGIVTSDDRAAEIGKTVGRLLWGMTDPACRSTTEGVIDVALSIYVASNIQNHCEHFRRPLDEWLGKIIAIGVDGARNNDVLALMAKEEGILTLLCKAAAHDIRVDREGFDLPAPLAFLKFEKALRGDAKEGGAA